MNNGGIFIYPSSWILKRKLLWISKRKWGIISWTRSFEKLFGDKIIQKASHPSDIAYPIETSI